MKVYNAPPARRRRVAKHHGRFLCPAQILSRCRSDEQDIHSHHCFNKGSLELHQPEGFPLHCLAKVAPSATREALGRIGDTAALSGQASQVSAPHLASRFTTQRWTTQKSVMKITNLCTMYIKVTDMHQETATGS